MGVMFSTIILIYLCWQKFRKYFYASVNLKKKDSRRKDQKKKKILYINNQKHTDEKA